MHVMKFSRRLSWRLRSVFKRALAVSYNNILRLYIVVIIICAQCASTADKPFVTQYFFCKNMKSIRKPSVVSIVCIRVILFVYFRFSWHTCTCHSDHLNPYACQSRAIRIWVYDNILLKQYIV